MKQGCRRLKRCVLSFVLTVAMVLGMVPMPFMPGSMEVYADGGISYLDASGASKTCSTFTTVESGMTAWSNGWYVVNDDVIIDSSISVSDTVNLILCNGATLTASKGIGVGSDATFNIYAQSEDEALMGKLVAMGDKKSQAAGIGGSNSNFGKIVINGGNIMATGGCDSAGIGGAKYSSSGDIIINGGIVVANASDRNCSAGIGGGDQGYVSSITLNGGTISAIGDIQFGGAGIGAGSYTLSGAMTITIASGIKQILATKGYNSDCIGKGNDSLTIVNVVFKNGEDEVTGDAKEAVFYDTGEGESTRRILGNVVNHKITISDDIKASVTSNYAFSPKGETVTLTLGVAVDASTLKVNDGNSNLKLTDIGGGKYTFVMPDADVTVTATIAKTYSVALPTGMEIVSTTNAADNNSKYIEGTVVTFKPTFPYIVSDVSDGTNTLTADSDGNYKITVGTANITVTATALRSETIDLSEAPGDFNAINNDVLTGSTSHTVTIVDNANVTLNNATITRGIICNGSAEITLVGTNSVKGTTRKAGIQVGGSDTTLTIKGDGSLTSTGGMGGAGIGTGIANDGDTINGGNIVIEGGSVTAYGNHWNVKGDSNGIGTGFSYTGATNTIGTLTVYDTIDKVETSSINGSIVYMHNENDVTANKTDYFTIVEDGDYRAITPKDEMDYTITISDDIEHGTITAASTAKCGERVTITTTPESLYKLSSLTVEDANHNNISISDNRFIMPKGNVTIKAEFTELTAYLNETTGVLTLNGNVEADDVKVYKTNNLVTSIVCNKGTVLPDDCSSLFKYFSNVKIIDLSNADVSGVRNTDYMFAVCPRLTTIYVSASWNLENVEFNNSKWMFDRCSSLKGGNGTDFDRSHIDKIFAVIDGLDGQPGYLTCPKVSFDAGSGSGTMNGVYVTRGEAYTLPDCAFTAADSDHVFKEYSVIIGNAEPVAMMPGDELTVMDSMTITAVWAEHNHDYSYSADGATITAECKSDGCFLKDKKVSLSINAPICELIYDSKEKAAELSGLAAFNSFTGKNISDADITYTKDGETFSGIPTEAGTYTASISVEEQTASVTFEIKKATPVIKTIPSVSEISYGQALADSTLSDGEAMFGDNSLEGTFTWKTGTEKPAVSDGNETEYDVVFTPEDTDNFSTASCKVKLTVNKATSNPVTLSINGWTYGDEANSPSITKGFGKDTAIFTYCDSEDGTYETAVPLDAGTWYAKAVIPGTDDYPEGSAVQSFEIARKDLTITAGSKSKVYDGKELTKNSYTNTLLAEEDTIKSVKITGSLTNVGETANVPTDAVIENSDNTNVTANYDIEYVNGKLTVTKATPTYTKPEDKTITCAQTLSDITLPEGFTFVNADQELVFGDNTVKVKYTPKDTDNYEVINNISIKVTKSNHNLTKTDAKAASLTEAGNNAYWSCDKCGKYFSDEDATNEIEKDSWIIPKLVPTASPTPTATATPTAKPTATPTAKPTASPTSEPTSVPTSSPTAEPSKTPTENPTAEPTKEPTADPSATPSATPEVNPTAEVTATPSAEATETPSVDPTTEPTGEPTVEPSAVPTAEVTETPSGEPTGEPSATPTAEVTATPSAEATETPSVDPTTEPTGEPTGEPTSEPTGVPSSTPTVESTTTPVAEVTATPTAEVEATPTATPSATPSKDPTGDATPSATPTSIVKPTATATVTPTVTPTKTPTPTATPKKTVKKPKTPKFKSVKNKKTKKMTITWKKVKDVKGYQVQYALDKDFTDTLKTKSLTDTSLTVKKLKKKKTYYVRVRSYVKDSNNKKVYSKWSKVKKVKIKK